MASSSTTPSASIQCYQPDEINWQGLLHTLSLPPCLPTSIQVRNHILAGITSRPEILGEAGDAVVVDDPWKDFTQRYQPGAQLVVLGEPPAEVLLQGGNSSAQSDGLWGIALLVSSKFRNDADPATCLRRPNVSVWLSSESEYAARRLKRRQENPSLRAGEDDEKEVDPASRAMLGYMFRTWLPVAYTRFIEAQVGRFKLDAAMVRSEYLQEVDVIVQAIDATWLQVLLSEVYDPPTRAKRADGAAALSTAPPSRTERGRIDWHSTFDTFVLTPPILPTAPTKEEEALQAGARWQLEEITPQTAQTVADANKIPFPVDHALRKPKLSLLARDRVGPVGADGEGEEDNAYPAEQGKGRLAGWVYTHEDLSLASLHVALPYRRQVDAAPASAPPLSLGRLLVALLTPRVGLVQRRALATCGLDVSALEQEAMAASTASQSPWCPWPVTADVDASDAGSVRFYERLGCRRVARHCWLGVRAALAQQEASEK